MLQLNPLCLQQLCWDGRKLTHLCHIPGLILLHPSSENPLCLLTRFYLQVFTYKVFLVFVPFSLSSPLFQPKCSGCLMLLSRMLAGAFPACPSAPPGNTSPACRAAGVIPIYSAGSKNRTPRQAAMGAGKINRATEFELSCCNVSFHASFKEGSL